ncbi:MAG: cytochrome c maturation protein CcmE [Acidobacteria bacterium]|nr:cytochrome c maturation protein CcmE [Acidobacteriota bacterium]
MKKYGKFAGLSVTIIGVLVWLAAGGVSENKTYYKTISELGQMGDDRFEKRLRVAGDVDIITRKDKAVEFILTQDKLRLPVVYNGAEPLPDTFRPGAQALADGKMGRDGVFHAGRVQAKCASKYESKPGAQPGQQPAYLNQKTS